MMKILRSIRKDGRLSLLTVLLSLFIIFDIRPPTIVAEQIDSFLGRIIILLVVIVLLFSNPIVGALAVVAAYELFRRSEYKSAIQYVPSEKKKTAHLSAFNQFPKTLEEAVVQSMIPTASPKRFPPASFVPKAGDIHQAVPVSS